MVLKVASFNFDIYVIQERFLPCIPSLANTFLMNGQLLYVRQDPGAYLSPFYRQEMILIGIWTQRRETQDTGFSMGARI